MKTIGFIGIGVMGKSMVRNLMKHGYSVFIYTRTKSKALDVIKEGAVWCDDVKTCAQEKDAVITIVGYPQDVEEVYFGSGGILANAKPGAYVIDMTTTSPRLSERIYIEAKIHELFALDAPVSGEDAGARNGTLSIMVGGDREAFDACRELFTSMGDHIRYQGGAGCGQHTKMANQIALAGTIAGVCEAIAYARGVGLDAQAMLDSIGKGAAGSWQMANMAPRFLKEDMAPGFSIKQYIKDMKIADEGARGARLTLPILEKALSMYQKLAEEGEGSLGTQALIHYYEEA